MPKFGTREYAIWLNEFIAEGYRIIAKNYVAPPPREYAPEFRNAASRIIELTRR